MSRRLPRGGTLIDRATPVGFRFDGRALEGLAGDTLASALTAAGVDVVASSIHRGRPRGPLSAGREEPNAYVQIERDGVSEPLLHATEVTLSEGLAAEALRGRGRLLPAGAEPRYDHAWRHCDVLVVGGGPAGLAAALAAAPFGDVVLVDDGPRLGGALLDDGGETIDGRPALAWVDAVRSDLEVHGVTILPRANALGAYDDGLVVVAQRDAGAARERLWHLRARQVVVATGALERPIAFAGNDLPGVLLAGAARSYLGRWAVRPGERAVVFTTNDSAYAAADALAAAGVEVAAVVDPRPAAGAVALTRVQRHGIPVLAGHVVVGAEGAPRLESVTVAALGTDGRPEGPTRRMDADTLAVSGGWSPLAELACHLGVQLAWDPALAAFVPPAGSHAGLRCAGAAAGLLDLADGLADGWAAGLAAARDAGLAVDETRPAPVAEPVATESPRELWRVPGAHGWDTHFVDLHRDVTVADMQRAVDAGLRSPEHVKRFTTLGTGAEQGRTSGTLALGVLAELLGTPIDALAPTTARPPTVGASFALLAGRYRGALADPARRTPIHEAHVADGAVFEDAGPWKRARSYPRPGEDLEAAVARECRTVRTGVGIMDASTLGKIDVHGPDAAAFLDRLYTGAFANVAVGSAKYGILCRTDGMVFDDGVVMRLADDRYLVTTTSGNAAPVFEWFEEWLQTEWTDLRVHCTSVTEQWATVAVAGPDARRVLAQVAPGTALDADSFPMFAVRDAVAAGVPARLCRVSFSGELAFEIHVASWYGRAVWEACRRAGATPYGTEAVHVLRAEKGYFVVGQETDGSVTPMDVGYGWAVSKKKAFVGGRSHRRADTSRPDRPQLVALLTDDGATRVVEGARVRPVGGAPDGHVTSSYESVELGRPFALGLVAGGRERLGERVQVSHAGGWVDATLHGSVLVDPEGARRDG